MRRKTSGYPAWFFISLLLGASATFGLAGEQPETSGWTLVSDGPSELDASIRETVWRTPRPPGGPHDRIEVHRYRSGESPRAAVVYLPGTNMNGEAVLADENHNLWFFLAKRGVEVFALDYRTHFVSNGGVEDFSFMKEWTLAKFVEDAAEAAALARRQSGRERVFVAGFSRGVTLAYGLAASEPAGSVAGVIALDGSFKGHAPQGDFDYAKATEELLESGAFASDVAGSRGWQWRAKLMADAAANPDGPAQNEGFETIGAELAAVLYGAWGSGALTDPMEVSKPVVLARLLAGYDRYYPTIQNVEGRSLADYADDPNTPIDDGWAELDLPVLYFGATSMQRPFGASWLLNGIHSAAEAGGKDYEIHVLEGYGHLDVLVGETAREEVFEPTLEWIERRLP